MITGKKLTVLICTMFFVLISQVGLHAQTSTFPSGSAIIDMGSANPTVQNSLKPYGLVYALLKNNHVPVSVVVNPNKAKDGIDFVYNAKAYKGGTFIISSDYISSAVSSVLTNWANQGVLIDYTNSSLTVDVTYKINFVPKWSMDRTNGNIAVAFLSAAGIPSSGYSFKTPAQLAACDDIFVLPHADPTWNSHNNLYFWNRDHKGAIWAGCHAVSMLENLSRDTSISGVPTTLRTNFLSTNGLLDFTQHNFTSVPFGHHLPGDPVSQFYNKTDNAQLNGSETVYLPKQGSAWNTGAKIISSSPSQVDVPSLSPGTAVENIYGRAFDDPNRGYVAYQAAHNIGGTSADQIAAQRVFFNFSLLSLRDKVPPIIDASVTSGNLLTAGVASGTFTATVTGTGTGFTYQWSSSVAGTFSSPNTATTTFTPSNAITSTTDCIITCVVTESCGRVSFDAKKVTVIPPPADPGNPLSIVNINESIGDGCTSASLTFNVFTNNPDANAGTRTLVSVTGLGNGTVLTTSSGDVTFTPHTDFKGITAGSYVISNTVFTATGNISITVGNTALAPVLTNDAVTALVDQVTVISPLSNDKNNDAAATNQNDQLYIKDIPTKPSNGYAYINANGTLSYLSKSTRPTGIDQFQYLACNTAGYCSVGTISVTLQGGSCPTGNYQITTTAIISTVSFSPLMDSYLDATQTTTNFGLSPTTIANGSVAQSRKTMLKFDLSSIPVNATINSASLSLTVSSSPSLTIQNNPFPITLYSLLQPWEETSVTWENFSSGNAWSTPGASDNATDYSGSGTGHPSIIRANGALSAGTVLGSSSLTAMVTGWVMSPTNNHGMLLVNRTAIQSASVNFHSRQAALSTDYPTLTINYTAPAACIEIPNTYQPVLYPDASTVSSNISVTISPLTNDENYYGRGINLQSVSIPTHGTAIVSGNQIIYTPAGNYLGIETFTYTAADASSGITSTGTIRVTVTRVAPIIISDVATTLSASATTINVGSNDSDPQPGSVIGAPVIITSASNGIVEVISGTSQVTYTPSNGFVGTDQFTYRRTVPGVDACSVALSGTATVTVTVTNRAPSAGITAVGTFSCTPVTIDLVSISSDPEGGALSVTITSNPANGTLSVVGAGKYQYTPNNGFAATDNFSYTVTDPLTATSTAGTVTVTVSNTPNPNTAPIAVADSDNTLMAQPVYTNVIANDSDPNSDPLSISITAAGLLAPVTGTLTLMPNKLIKYEPPAGFSGTITYQYLLSDTHPDCSGSGTLSSTGTVTITVTAIPTTLSGTVWNDVDVSAINTSGGGLVATTSFVDIKTLTETGTNGNGSLYVYLVDNNNIIKDRTPVDINGTYQLSDVPSQTTGLKLIVNNEEKAIGATLTASSLPNGWVNSSPLIRALPVTTLADMGGYDWGIYTSPVLVAGTISATGDICVSGIPTINSTANASGGSLTATRYKYQWQISTSGAGGVFTDLSDADSLSSYTAASAITQTTWYRRSVGTRGPNNVIVDATIFSSAVTVTVNSLPTVSITPASATIGTGLTATFTASGANTYTWTPAANLSATNTATVIAGPLTTTTAYTVSGTVSATGCSNTSTITVTVIDPGIIVGNQVNCGAFTPTTISSGTDASGGSITYSWESSTQSATAGFAAIGGAISSTYSPGHITATTYFKRIATSGGSSFSSNVITKTVNTVPTVSITPTTVTIGTGLTATLTASGADAYTWTPATHLSATNTATVTAGPLTGTTAYTVSGTVSATGCSNTSTVTVTVIDPGQIGDNEDKCGIYTPASLSSTTLATGGTISYTWELSTTSSTGGFITIDAATSSGYAPTGNITTTTWYRRVAKSGSQSFYSNVVTKTVRENPVATASNNSPICAGAALNLTSSGGTGYGWTGPNGFANNTQNPTINTATTAASGTYSVVVTAANGCTSTATTLVTVNSLPTISVNPTSVSITSGGSVLLTASGANTYSWGPSAGLSATNTAVVTASPLTTTTYTVNGTSTVTGCTNTTTVVVTVVPDGALLPGLIGSDIALCLGVTASSFTSTTNASGGTGTINYQWQHSLDNTVFTNITGAVSATYNAGAISQTTYYRRGASTSNNTVVYSNTVKITVQQTVAGTISGGGLSVCSGTNSGTLTLTGHTGSVLRWESSTNGFSTITTISNTTNVLSYNNISATTQYRAVVQLGSCASINTSAVTVTATPLPVIGAVAGPCAMTKDSIKTFMVAPVANATGYVWQLPSGWSGTSTTNTINVKAGVTAGNITVTAVNNGCSGISSTSAVSVTIIDHAKITITATPTITSGNLTSTMLVTVQLYDVNGKIVNCSGGIATLCSNIPSAVFSTVVDHGDGTYTSYLSSPANQINICGTVGGIPLSKTTTVTFTGPQGGIKGNGPILAHETPKVTFTFTAGVAPYTVIYRSAKSNKNDTLTNVISGQPIAVPLIPSTTLYTLVQIIDGNGERRVDNFNRDTATIVVLAPKIVVTLKSDAPVHIGDSTWSTRLALHVKNIGDLDLANVQVKLNLKDVFPPPVNYVLDSVRVNGRTIVQNPRYDGVQETDLFAAIMKQAGKLPATIQHDPENEGLINADGIDVYGNSEAGNEYIEAGTGASEHSVYMFGPSSQLPINEDGFMYLYLRIKPNGHYEPFTMQAVALGTGHTAEGSALTTSLSNDNENTAAHPEITEKGDPVPTVINLIPVPVIGVSLMASTPADQGNGTYNVTLSYKLHNYGNVNLQSVHLFQNLARMIGSPAVFTLVGGITTTGTLLPNPSFNAGLDSNLLLPLSELGMGEEATVQFTINIRPNQLSALYRLQAQATAVYAELNLPVSDLSTDGTDPDPDGNKTPSEKVLTLIVINQPVPPLVPPGIGINIDPPNRTTVLTKTYCVSANVRNIPTGVPTGGSGPYEFQWQGSSDNILFTDIAGATDSVYTTSNTTVSTYLRMKVVSDNQVAFTNPVHIVIVPLPAKPVITGSATQVVGVGNISLSSSIATTYSWTGGATTRAITATSAGSYTVTITDNNGCSATSDAYTITALDPYKVADIQKRLTKSPELQYDGSFIMNFRVYASNLRTETIDSVRIKDDLTKVFPSSVHFEVMSIQASGNLIANNLYNGSSNIELVANGSQLPGMKSDSVQIVVKVLPNGFTGTLLNVAELTGKSPYGVFKVTSNDPTVSNGVLARSPTPFFIPLVDLFIPSGFSPNRDGMNDLFVISRPFNTTINMEIFNRWGNLVYRNTDYKNDWGGRGNQPNNILGEELPDGTYYYIILATDKSTGNVKKFAGFITLKR